MREDDIMCEGDRAAGRMGRAGQRGAAGIEAGPEADEGPPTKKETEEDQNKGRRGLKMHRVRGLKHHTHADGRFLAKAVMFGRSERQKKAPFGGRDRRKNTPSLAL